MARPLDIETLEACFGEASDAIASFGRDGRCIYANRSARQQLGLSLGDALCQTSRAELRPLEQLLRRALEHGRSGSEELERSGRRYEHRSTLTRDDDGSVAGITIFGRDVTREIRTLADVMPSLVWTTDAEGETTWMSREWTAYTGGDRDDEGWRRWEQRVPPEDLAALGERWAACLAEGTPGIGRVRIRRADGALRWHVARIVPLRRVESRVTAWVGTATDVHDELRAKGEAEAILAAAPLGISLHDRELQLVSVNDAALAMHGVGARTDEHLRRVLETGEPVRDVETTVRGAHGALAHHLTNVFPVRIEGEVAGVGVVVVDVTERKRMEVSLRGAHQRLTFHVDNSPLAVIEWDREFRVASWSRGAEALFGWSASEVLGKHPDEWRFVHSGDAPDVHAKIARLLSGAEPRHVSSGRYHRRDGEVVHCEWYDSTLHDERADAVSVLSLVLDVTPRVRAQCEHERRLVAEQEARAQAELERARFHRLLLHAPALVAILRGPDHVYEFLNERFCETIPEARRLVGTSARKHRADLVEEHFLDLLDQVYETGEPYETTEVPLTVARPGGFETLYLTFVYQPIRRADGTVEGIASFAFDVSESVLARKQVEEASRAKDDFLSTLSHELRTPLNAIVGWSHLLRTGAIDEGQSHRALEAIERNAKVQKRLIDDLLDFARMVSGKLGLQLATLDLASVVGSAIESVRPSLDAKKVSLALEISARPQLSGDADRLQQVVWNLLSNAIKFTGPRGSVRARVGVEHGLACVDIEDDGLGIDPPFLPFVFERFRQADSTTTRRHGGLGLGLAIARSIVELHGGTIEARSEGLGRGATIRVRLPMRDAPQVASSDARTVAIAARARLDGVRALVVDDEEDARLLVGAALASDGAEIRLVSSVAEALDALHGAEHDVLVSDIGMPDLDGVALIQRIRALPAPASRIPAIAVTAYARGEDRDRAVGAGFDGFLTKPIDVEELGTLVARVLGRIDG